MNKKVLTLCAGMLLAGGLISTANATKLTDVVDNGKYYQLKMSKYCDASAWTNTPTTWDAQYLSMDADGFSFLNTPDAKEGFWTIIDVQKSGEQLPSQTTGKIQLINASTGKPLSITFGTAPNTKVIDEFYTESGPSGDVLGLVFYEGGTRYELGGVSTAGTTQDDLTYGVWGSLSGVYLAGLEVEEIPEVALKAKQMNAQLNGGFELSFTSNGKEYKNLTQAEAFAGKLTAVGVNVADPDDADEVANSSDTEYYFRTSDGSYVILDDEYLGTITSTLDGTKSAFYRGYNFTTISEHAFAQLSNKEKKNAAFTVFRTYDFNDTDSLIVAVPGANTIGKLPNKELNPTLPDGSDNPEKGLRLFISTVTVNGTEYDVLTTIDYTKANDKLAAVKDNNYNNAQMGAWAPYIAFGSSNIVNWNKFAGKVWNITDEKGNVLSPKFAAADVDDYPELFAPAGEVDLTNPEGQWLLDDAGNSFVNRESGELAIKNDEGWTIRDLGNDKYALYNSKFDTKATYTIYIKEAKDAELGWTENGYVKFDMDEEQNNGKYLSFKTTFGTAYVGKDADDNVILTQDINEAIEFRVKQMEHNFVGHDGVQAPDTLQHYTSFLNKDAKGKIFEDVDTLQFFQYALYENFSEKVLEYDKQTKKFRLTEDSWTSNAHENFDQEGQDRVFVVKAREDGSYILVRDYAIDYDKCINDATHNHEIQPNWNGENATFDNIFEVNFGDNALTVWNEKGTKTIKRSNEANGQAHKLYAGTQKDGFLTDMADIYNYNDNDRITIEATNKVEYMKFEADLDTVKVSLAAKPNFFLYEHNENGTNFLGMEHVADVDDMKAAIFVDTAYVRNNTDRPQYLLAVGANHVDEIWDNHGSEDPVHLLHADTTYGRFLVNMVDSAKAWKGSVKTNPYIHEELNDNYYYRLAFIDGIHTGDALILNTTGAKTKINLNNNNEKVCTFSFRYVDEDREGVKIETTYDGKTRGWLKYQNNVPVVTNDYEDAHVFLVDNTTTEAPTANETISAEGAVSVVATDGAVTIKGAEGKNVVIATILGKVVANEVINSDNETIAVPAGIAVVSVDGESFKVVVK